MNTFADHRLRMGAALGVAGLVVFAAAGCGGDATTPASAGSEAAPSTSTAKVLKGAKLRTLLLPAGAMPKGFQLSPDGVRNTGDAVAPPSRTAVAPGKVCGMLQQTSWTRVSGIDSATFAQNDFVDAGHTNQFAQEIESYHGDDAQKVMSGLRKAFAHCASFTDTSDGMRIKVKLVRSALPGAGDEGIKAVQTSPAWQGGMTYVAIRVGNSVVTAFYSSSHADKGAAAVKMAKKIAQNVRSAS
jgi:hypothetical protein